MHGSFSMYENVCRGATSSGTKVRAIVTLVPAERSKVPTKIASFIL